MHRLGSDERWKAQTDIAPLIDRVYATIRNPQIWPEVVAAIAAWIGADKAMMTSTPLRNANSLPIVFYNMDLSPVQGRPLLSHPEFTLRAIASGRAPGVALFDELMPPAEQQTNEYWQTIIKPLNIGSGLLCVARTPDDNGKPVVISFHRHLGARPFGDDEVEALKPLLPHLRRALGVVLDTPPSAHAEVQDLYSNIGAPTFFFDGDANIVHQNQAAELLLAAGDGLNLGDNRLVLFDEAAQREFDAAIKRVIGEGWSRKLRLGAELLARRSEGPPMVLVLTPLGAENPIAQWAAPVRCVMFVLEEELRVVGMLPSRLMRIYGLTSAEADIAIALATGANIRDVARERGTKADTVRTQVKRVMAKTTTRRQSDLAALISRLRF